MVLQSIAHTEYDSNSQEVRVYSRHSFDGTDVKIIGAVSVLFVQPLDKSFLWDCQDQDKISSSLSVITVPGLSNLDSRNTSSVEQNNVKQTYHGLRSGFSIQQDLDRNNEHVQFNQNFSCNQSMNQESKSRGENSVSSVDYPSSHNVSIIDFSKQLEPESLHSHSNSFEFEKNKKNVSTFKPSHKVANEHSFKVPNSTANLTVCSQVLRKIPETSAITNAQFSSLSQKLSKNVPKTVYSAQERKVVKNKSRQLRIKCLTVTKDKNCDVRCSICQQKLETSSEIISHSALHALQLECCVCEAKFASYCNMRRHCSGHVQTTLYKCSLCQVTYKRKDNLQTHIKKHYTNAGLLWRNPSRPLYMRTNSSSARSVTSSTVTGPDKPINKPRDEYVSTVLSPTEYQGNMNRSITQIISDVRNIFSTSSSTPEENHIDLTKEHEIDLTFDENGCSETKKTQDTMTRTSNIVQNTVPINNVVINNIETSKQNNSNDQKRTEPLLNNQVCASLPINKESSPATTTNKIVNYSCSSCSLHFDHIESLKRHILSNHSEEINRDKQTASPAKNSQSFDIKQEIPPVTSFQSNYGDFEEFMDMEKLSELTNNLIGESLKNQTFGTNIGINSFSSNVVSPVTSSYNRPINNKVLETPKTTRKRRQGASLSSIAPLCRICGFVFKDIQQVIDHRLTHTNEIPEMYGCTICTTELSSKECLRRHVKGHMGEEHHCYYCPAKYNRVDNLYTHMKNAHNWVRYKQIPS